MAYQTPYFVIDENQLTKDFQMLKSSLETSWGNYRIGYSFKTNSLPWLVTFLKAGGVMAEVVSEFPAGCKDRRGAGGLYPCG